MQVLEYVLVYLFDYILSHLSNFFLFSSSWRGCGGVVVVAVIVEAVVVVEIVAAAVIVV